MLIPSIRSRLLFPLAERLSGRMINARVDWLRAEFKQSWENRQRKNRYRLVEVLQNAKYEIPYYRDLFQKIKFDPNKVLKDDRYFEQLPILTKEDIREAGERILHPKCKQYLTVQINRTNGSTGSALPIYYTPTAKDYAAAVTRMTQEWIGFDSSKLQLHISSAFPDGTPPAASRQEWWRQQAMNRISVECDTWNEEALALLWSKIIHSGAYLVQGHPSTLYALARHVQQRMGRYPGAFHVFVSTGESLNKQQRELIENVFGCRVTNRYGNAEFGIIAHEHFVDHDMMPAEDKDSSALTPAEAQAKHYLQIMDPYVWVETLSMHKEGRQSLIVTDLTNMSSPLIRYATGDEGLIVQGTHGMYITSVLGRVHDIVTINEIQYPTHWFQDSFTRLGNVDDFQFVRREEKSLELRVCLIDSSGENALREKLAEWFPNSPFNLRFVTRSEFVRVGQQQKFRYLVDMPSGESINVSPQTSQYFDDYHHELPFAFASGWNNLEIYGDISFRWMQKKGKIAINPHSIAKKITIEYHYPEEVSVFPRLLILLNNKPLKEGPILPGPNCFTIILPDTDMAERVLTLEVDTLYPVPADPRELGLRVHSVKIEE